VIARPASGAIWPVYTERRGAVYIGIGTLILILILVVILL
jgi:hypothetical protein